MELQGKFVLLPRLCLSIDAVFLFAVASRRILIIDIL